MIENFLTLDIELEQQLTEHAENIIRTPNRYLRLAEGNRKVLPRDPNDISLYDPNLPGVSDEYITSGLVDIFNHKNAHQVCRWLYKIVLPPMPVLLKFFNAIENTVGKKVSLIRGTLLYPPGGYMGWHTNSDMIGTRLYLAYSNINKGSYFKYIDMGSGEKQIITSWDKKGWNIRMFEVTSDPKQLYWHCIESITAHRVSFGFMLSTKER